MDPCRGTFRTLALESIVKLPDDTALEDTAGEVGLGGGGDKSITECDSELEYDDNDDEAATN